MSREFQWRLTYPKHPAAADAAAPSSAARAEGSAANAGVGKGPGATNSVTFEQVLHAGGAVLGANGLTMSRALLDAKEPYKRRRRALIQGNGRFEQVLQGALCSEQTTRAWHESSKSYKPTKVRRAMVTAPNVLCIDTGLESPYAEGARLYREARAGVGGAVGAESERGGGAAGDGGGEPGAGGAGGGSLAGGGAGSVEGGRGPLDAKGEWLPMRMSLRCVVVNSPCSKETV